MYEYIFFDLDGTLTDPGEGITNSVAYSLRHYGIDVPDRAELYRFIGPPLVDSYIKYYGFSPERAREAVEVYREYFREKGIFENKLYGGTRELLEKTVSGGKRAVLATSKPEPFAKTIIEHFGLEKYFTFIAGALMDETRTKKADVIAYALQNIGQPDRSRVLMVGDRMHDIMGAKENGIASVGVLFGYGSEEELKTAGADHIAKDMDELCRVIFGEDI